MSAKHTPGPWTTVFDCNGMVSVAANGSRRFNSITAGTPVIADVHQHEDAEYFSGEANAALVAAAPELLEYLQYAVWAHPELAKNEKLMAVIAKATAQQ